MLVRFRIIATLLSVVLLLSIGLQAKLQSENAAHQHFSPQQNIPEIKSVAVFHDKYQRLTFTDVLSVSADEFINVPSFNFVGGFIKGSSWFKINFNHANISAENWYLEIDNAYLDSIEFYYKDTSLQWHVNYAGNLVPLSQQPISHYHYVFPIFNSKNSGAEYYIKVSTKGSTFLPLKLIPDRKFRKHTANSIWAYGMLYGAMLFMLIYHVVVAITLKSRTYAYFALFLLFNTLFQSLYFGHFRQFFLPEGGDFVNYSILVSLAGLKASALIFAIYFLRFSSEVIWSKILKIIAGLWLLLLAFPLFIPYSISAFAFTAHSTISVVVIIVAAYSTLRTQRRRATLFLIAWIVYLLGAFISDMRVLGLDLFQSKADSLLQFGTILNALLLALALADRINHYRNEKFKAKQIALDAVTEQQKLADQYRITLETKVRERTSALEEKQAEVLDQNSKLYEQQQIIENQYDELHALNGELERKVQKRTYELRASNKDLLKRKQQLEQFAFITSHNLRGPVASMIGLLKLVDTANIADTENITYLNMLDKSVNKLDGVLKDLDEILKLEKNYDGQAEKICYQELVEDILEKLSLQVQEAKPNIEWDFKEMCITSHKAYLDSIWYNLISNSIKYRQPNRQLTLHLKSWKTDQGHHFSVGDNGLGMNLEEVEGKLFTLYQRFHHGYAEGKGLGLYLLKSQVNILKGKVEVSSEKGQGTVFTVLLPPS